MFYFSLFAVFLLDQAVKYVISIKMIPAQSIPLINNYFYLTYVQNRGAAFGLFPGRQGALAVIGIALIAFVFYYYYRSGHDGWVKIPLGLLAGGSLGNLFDRIVRHYVVDYLDFRYKQYGWPVFNLADIMIDIGVFLIIASLILNKEGQNASHTS